MWWSQRWGVEAWSEGVRGVSGGERSRLVGVCSNNCIYFLSLIKRIIYGLFKNLNALENARRQKSQGISLGEWQLKRWVSSPLGVNYMWCRLSPSLSLSVSAPQLSFLCVCYHCHSNSKQCQICASLNRQIKLI